LHTYYFGRRSAQDLKEGAKIGDFQVDCTFKRKIKVLFTRARHLSPGFGWAGASFRACLEIGFESEKRQFFDDVRHLFEGMPGRYGRKKQRIITKKVIFAAQRLASKHAFRGLVKYGVETASVFLTPFNPRIQTKRPLQIT